MGGGKLGEEGGLHQGAGVRGTPVHSCLTNAFFFLCSDTEKQSVGGSLTETRINGLIHF